MAVKKNIDRNAAPFNASEPPETLSARDLNSRNGTSGAADRRSTTTNAPSSRTPATSTPTTSNDPHPAGSDRTTPYTTANSPAVPRTAPSVSNVRRPTERRTSGTKTGISATSASTIGTFTKNTHCQLSESTSTPPTTTPSVPPSPARPPQTPI